MSPSIFTAEIYHLSATPADWCTDLLSLLEGEELEAQLVWELDIRETNFWMVLREGALIRELRRL